MVIGVLSDSHGRAETTRRAVALLLASGAERLIHLGDLETEAVIDELVGYRAHIVFGNCDDEPRLASYARAVGVVNDHPMGTMTVDGREIAFTHGDRGALMESALRSGAAYLLHGHSHAVRDERVGATRVINPGALFRARRYTVAVLDPAQDRLDFLDVDGRG